MRRGQQASISYKCHQEGILQYYLDEPMCDVQKLMFLPILIDNITDDSLTRRWVNVNWCVVRYKYYQ